MTDFTPPLKQKSVKPAKEPSAYGYILVKKSKTIRWQGAS